jgi:hypothetical protein
MEWLEIVLFARLLHVVVPLSDLFFGIYPLSVDKSILWSIHDGRTEE